MDCFVCCPTEAGRQRKASGRFQVVAGGRKLAGLRLSARAEAVTKGHCIPSRVLGADSLDEAEASLAENVVRQDIYPADQFEAFHRPHDVAARFGVSAHTVRRLAYVSPALIQAYRNKELTLYHLAVFTATEAGRRIVGRSGCCKRGSAIPTPSGGF